MKTILLSQEISPQARALLEGKARILVPDEPGQEAFEKLLPEADALILRTNVRLTAVALSRAGKLKVVSRTGAGVDNVDVAACHERGVMVANTPDANTQSVVEHTLALALALSKRLKQYDAAVRAGNWKIRSTYAARELYGAVLGIIGYGRIGRRVAQAFRGTFDMKVVVYDPYLNGDEQGVTVATSAAEVFRQADIVTLHCPSIPQTRRMVNAALLKEAKPGMLLINCARGDIVVEDDLIWALMEGVVGGAGLDVFESEPLGADSPLRDLDNVILTPHTAALTREASVRVAVEAARQALTVLEGGKPEHLV